MTVESFGPPHDPAPVEPRRLLPEWPYLVRGILLAGGAMASLVAAGGLARRSALLIPVALPAIGAGVLAAWAAAIQLTGGRQQDDHPWV